MRTPIVMTSMSWRKAHFLKEARESDMLGLLDVIIYWEETTAGFCVQGGYISLG